MRKKNTINLPFDIKLLLIPSATFKMGRLNKDREYSPLIDPFDVTITEDYCMTETPITNIQYKAYLDDTKQTIPTYLIEHWEYELIKRFSFKYYLLLNPLAPVVGVSYEQAQNFAKWISAKTNNVFRLPTEEEFEWAAKAGCNCTNYCKNAVKIKDDLRSYGETPKNEIPPIKRYEPNDFGLYDMNGLIWQWCSNWYNDQYSNNNLNELKEDVKHVTWRGMTHRAGRVIRGGSFNYGVLYSRCSARHFSLEDDQNFNLGFRLVAEASNNHSKQ